MPRLYSHPRENKKMSWRIAYVLVRARGLLIFVGSCLGVLEGEALSFDVLRALSPQIFTWVSHWGHRNVRGREYSRQIIVDIFSPCQRGPFSSAKGHHPKMPIRDPQDESPENPCIGLFLLGMTTLFNMKALTLPALPWSRLAGSLNRIFGGR